MVNLRKVSSLIIVRYTLTRIRKSLRVRKKISMVKRARRKKTKKKRSLSRVANLSRNRLHTSPHQARNLRSSSLQII